MDSAKQALHNIERKAGHHDTTVHERVGPAVTKETVKPERVEEVKTAVDKEVHQDHYHRTVQPVFDKEVLPEKHEHRVAGVEKREFDNRHNDNTRERFEAERGQHRDERHVAETKTTHANVAGVAGERVHHHVHEEIQPVLHKEVVQPEVVHTTVPVHEVHHESAKHHGTTTLPPVSASEFKQQGGSLHGREERRDHFEGCAKGLHEDGCGHDKVTGESLGHGHHGHHSGSNRETSSTGVGSTTTGNSTHGHTHGHSHEHSSTTGTHGAGVGGIGAAGAAGATTGAATHSSGTIGSGVGSDSRLPGAGQSNVGSTTAGQSTSTTGTHSHGLEQTETQKKASLLDKLNPLKDADGDGKKGFMS